jgi:GntR family transcriptional repressor for pyruvate dehydrogenase complex
MVVASGGKSTKGAASVLESIWVMVRESGLKAGDQLPSIRELADRLELKHTAVRDALLKAEAMGLVDILPRAGAFLRANPPGAAANEEPLAGAFQEALVGEAPADGEQNLFHLLDARRLIEIELAGRAAERRLLEDLLPVRRALEALLQLPADAPRSEYVAHDIRFHVEIARLSGNQVLFAVQRTLMELLRPHLNEVPRDRQCRSKTDHSHRAIYEALVAGDAEKARKEMREHLSLAYDGLLRDIQKIPAISS